MFIIYIIYYIIYYITPAAAAVFAGLSPDVAAAAAGCAALSRDVTVRGFLVK